MNYLELQRQVVDKLREIGVYYAYDDRLALFWLRVNIPRLYKVSDDLVRTLDELTELRKKGLEPAHENGKYVSS